MNEKLSKALIFWAEATVARSPVQEPQNPESGNYDDSRDYGFDLATWSIAEELRKIIKENA